MQVQSKGFSLVEGIIAPTKMPAEAARIAEKTGILEIGRLTDLQFAESDPSGHEGMACL